MSVVVKLDRTRTARMRRLERAHGNQRIEVIIKRAAETNPTLVDAAKELGVSFPTLYEWIKRLGIQVEIDRGNITAAS